MGMAFGILAMAFFIWMVCSVTKDVKACQKLEKKRDKIFEEIDVMDAEDDADDEEYDIQAEHLKLKALGDAFKGKYIKAHCCCPECGEMMIRSQTLVCYILDTSDMDSYKDENTATCAGCEDRHIIHDRVSRETAEEIKTELAKHKPNPMQFVIDDVTYALRFHFDRQQDVDHHVVTNCYVSVVNENLSGRDRYTTILHTCATNNPHYDMFEKVTGKKMALTRALAKAKAIGNDPGADYAHNIFTRNFGTAMTSKANRSLVWDAYFGDKE